MSGIDVPAPSEREALLREALTEALPWLMAAVFHPSMSQASRARSTLDKARAALSVPLPKEPPK